jgi:bifunctional non-homologous end joining protein LigD
MTIESTSLYYKEGVSDKLYNAAIEEKNGGFVVNFSYGRRGGALKSGTKTNNAVSLDQAKKIYESLLKEKTGKGYQKIPLDQSQAIHVPENLPETISESKCVLLNPIKESQLQDYINDENWLAQPKFDGVRFMLHKKDKTLRAYNRRGLNCNIPTVIWNDSEKHDKDFLLDGELVGEKYYVFDILEYDGEKLENFTLVERLKYLDKFKSFSESVCLTDSYYTKQEKEEFYKKSFEKNEEGVVFKEKSAKYYIGRPSSGGSYVKYKFYATCSCFVTEINEGKRSVKLGLLNGRKLIDCGKVTIPVNYDVPEVGAIVEIRYLYAYKQSGNLYQPTYLGMRQDIQDSDCQKSQLKYKKEED